MKVLDFGYVELIESWGSDEAIIEAARMSTSKGFLGWGILDTPRDEKLLRYLWVHQHLTPFEMAGATLEIQCPIFVAREIMRHRSLSWNELSARYTELPPLSYIPSAERLMAGKQNQKNKQSSGTGFSQSQAEKLQNDIVYVSEITRTMYQELLKVGLSRELARLIIPVNQYTRLRMAGNLRNLLHFLELRMDEAAQWETQQFANAIGIFIAKAFPRTWTLFMEGTNGS